MPVEQKRLVCQFDDICARVWSDKFQVLERMNVERIVKPAFNGVKINNIYA